MAINGPCLNCPDRSNPEENEEENCHMTCERYLDYKQKMLEAFQRRRADARIQINSPAMDCNLRRQWRR